MRVIVSLSGFCLAVEPRGKLTSNGGDGDDVLVVDDGEGPPS